jgi:hypothetical protein
MKMNYYLIGLLMISSFFIHSHIIRQTLGSPEKNAKMANPVKSDAESLKIGKEVWISIARMSR